MKKSNNKGFMLVETLVVSTLILTTLTVLFVQFQNISKNYHVSFTYNTVNGLYAANNIRQYLNENGLYQLIVELDNSESGYIDLTNCDNIALSEYNYCHTLFNKLNVKTVLFTNENIVKFRNYLKQKNEMDQKFIEFINTIKENAQSNTNYRLIIQFNDDTYATLVINIS